MKKPLLILLCLPLMTLAQQTYVPDDNFEAWIETTYPTADNGAVNDNFVLTAGIDFLNQLGPNGNPIYSSININNSMGPIFDLTGVEDFQCLNLTIQSTFITSLDLSNLDLYHFGNYWSSITISQNQYLEEVILPNNTDTLTLYFQQNDSLNNIVFQSTLSYRSISITNHESLCELVFKGKLVDVNSAFNSVLINAASNIVQLDFSGITDAPYQTGISIALNNIWTGASTSNLQQVNLNNNISIYNWIFSAGSIYAQGWHPNFSCFEVNSQSAANFCAGNNAWPSFLNYSTNCYIPINCQTTTLIEEQRPIKRHLIKIIDILGRETKHQINTPLFYIYNDGTVEKKLIIENCLKK